MAWNFEWFDFIQFMSNQWVVTIARATVTVSFGEGDSAVNAAKEYGNFDRKQITYKACSDFCFDNVLQTP